MAGDARREGHLYIARSTTLCQDQKVGEGDEPEENGGEPMETGGETGAGGISHVKHEKPAVTRARALVESAKRTKKVIS